MIVWLASALPDRVLCRTGMLVRQTWLWLVFTGLLVTTATAQSRPEPPSDALSARVFHVLDRHCASCHQRSAISQLDARYGGGIDNILDLQATAQDRRLVSPGLPEASPLFTTIMARTMPPPAHLKAEGQEGMSARELLTLYDWLRATDATRTNCATRSYTLTDTDLASASEYLAAKGVIGARTVRFLHLGRPNPQCMPSGEAARKSLAQELSAARLALNSLSWSPVPVSLDLLTTDTTWRYWGGRLSSGRRFWRVPLTHLRPRISQRACERRAPNNRSRARTGWQAPCSVPMPTTNFFACPIHWPVLLPSLTSEGPRTGRQADGSGH